MNDQDATTILERLVADAPVAPPPVADVSARGRRRLLVRRGGQVMVTAAVVTAFTLGGLALRPAPSIVGVAGPSSASAPALPGQPPTAAELIGTWHWTRAQTGTGVEAGRHPAPVTFSKGYDVVRPMKPTNGSPLMWSGLAGCKRGGLSMVAEARLAQDGSFSTGTKALRELHCEAGNGRATSLGDLMLRARWVRLVDGELRFYDVHRHPVGAFSKS